MARRKKAKVKAKHKRTKKCGRTFTTKSAKRKKKTVKRAGALPFTTRTCPGTETA